MKNRVRLYEYIHIPLWLVKDTCWALQIKSMGVLMIFPTLFLALVICRKTIGDYVEFLPNIAILFWILANSIWMIDEFFELNIKVWCYLPFGLGMLSVIIWLIFFLPMDLRKN